MAYEPTLTRPRVYTASKFERGYMWKPLVRSFRHDIEFVSTWFHSDPLANTDDLKCMEGWIRNMDEMRKAEYLIAFGKYNDKLSGTLLEIGAALALDLPTFLVGDYDWNTWQHHPRITIRKTGELEETLLQIIERKKHDATNG